MYQLIAYIKFLFRSTNQHGVHSPFVYDFVTQCLYDKSQYKAYPKLKAYREALKNSNTILEITDLGEGSKSLGNSQRKVSDMVKTSSSSKKEAQLLFRISQYFSFKTLLEIGTSLGMGTYAMALADKNSNITTIEGCSKTSNLAKLKLKELEISNTKFMQGDFKTIIPKLESTTFDFVYFDGHHNKEATLFYFKTLLSKAHNETVFVFDDIYWSKGMTEAWEIIKAHNDVKVTVDCFHLGFVFFRKEQMKEHFKIRM